MPNETVAVTISGANGPKTINVTVPMSPDPGNPGKYKGTQTVTYTGTNGGSDTLAASATVTGLNLSSNTAQVNWQTTNNNIQLAGLVDCYAWGDSPHSGPVSVYIWSSGQRPLASAPQHGQQNSLCFDNFAIRGSGEGAPWWYTLNSSGSQTGYITFPSYSADFNCIFLGKFLVPKAGNYSITMSYKDSTMWGIGTSDTGAVPTWSGKGTYYGPYGQTQTVNSGYPLMNTPSPNDGGGISNTITTTVTFPAAGVYPFEINYDYWYRKGTVGRHMHVQSNYAEVAPNTYIGLPPTGATPTGKLTITPTGGSTNLQFVGQPISLTVTVSDIAYTSVSYIPVLEGTTGTLPLYNSASLNSFTFQQYNSQSVDKTAAIANSVFGLSGDNSAWNGRSSVTFDGTNFVLNFSGAAPTQAVNHIDTTNLTVSAKDIAWYFSGNKSFDLFGISQSGGGISNTVLVNWFSKPVVASVSPTSVNADGASHTFAVTLKNPISPRQMGTQYGTGNSFQATFTANGGTVTTTTPVYDASGWLTGWNVAITVPNSTSNGTITLSALINTGSGTLTYLNGSSFTTGPVTYLNGQIATINTVGAAYTAPQPYSFATSPTTLAYSDASSTAISLTGVTFQQQNNPITLKFIGVNQSNNAQFQIVNGTQSSRVTGTYNGNSGWLTTFTGSMGSSSLPYSPGATLGFLATDSTSGLTCSYQTSSVYYQYTPSGGGGGGGGGCFNAAMPIQTPDGFVEMGSLPKDRPFEIINQRGLRLAELIIHENYKGWMIKLAPGKLVTLEHLMKLVPEGDDWLPADHKYFDRERVWFEGTVYNLHVISDDPMDQQYILWNGDVAHNVKALNVDLVL